MRFRSKFSFHLLLGLPHGRDSSMVPSRKMFDRRSWSILQVLKKLPEETSFLQGKYTEVPFYHQVISFRLQKKTFLKLLKLQRQHFPSLVHPLEIFFGMYMRSRPDIETCLFLFYVNFNKNRNWTMAELIWHNQYSTHATY